MAYLAKILQINTLSSKHCGPGSSAARETGYGLDGLGNRIPVEARFSAPVQTNPGAHPASYIMGTGSFLGVKSGRGMTLTPHPPSSAMVMNK
jgi:hypothetical protein